MSAPPMGAKAAGWGRPSRRSDGRATLRVADGLDRGVSEEAVPRVDEFGVFVPHDVRELRRLVADLLEDFMFWRVLRVPLGTRVLINEGRGAGEAGREDVVLTVAVEVVHPREEMVGVAFAVLGLRRVDLVLLLNFGPANQEGTYTISAGRPDSGRRRRCLPSRTRP